MSTATQTSTDIRPFHVDITEEKLDDLRDRIAATRWPTKELVADRSQGVQLATLQALSRYWRGADHLGGAAAPPHAPPPLAPPNPRRDAPLIPRTSTPRHPP